MSSAANDDVDFKRELLRAEFARRLFAVAIAADRLLPMDCADLSALDVLRALPADVRHLERSIRALEETTANVRIAFDALARP